MIAVDTSSLIAYLQGDSGNDVIAVDQALASKHLFLPAVVLTEVLSDPKLSKEIKDIMTQLPLLEILDGFWLRAAQSRSKVISKGFKARVADALIAQACLDCDATLITRDKDFRHYEKFCGLKLL